MTKKTVDLLLFLTAIFWGLGYISVDNLLYGGMNSFTIIGIRFLIASIFLNVVFFKRFKLKVWEFKYYIIIGTTLFLAFLFQTIALKYTTTTNVSFITSMNILFVPILSFVLFKKPIEVKHVIAIFITSIGLFILTGGIKNIVIGDILTVICAILFGLHIVLIARFSLKVDIIKLAIAQMYITAILGIIISVLVGNNIVVEIYECNKFMLIFTGLIPSALCFLLQNIGLKYTDEARGSLILGTEALWGAFFAIILLNEQITYNIIIGGALMLSAILLDEVNIKRGKYVEKNMNK